MLSPRIIHLALSPANFNDETVNQICDFRNLLIDGFDFILENFGLSYFPSPFAPSVLAVVS
jgi:hypothetical protein